MEAFLSHEKLDVYGEALAFVRATLPLVNAWPPSHAVRDQIGRALESVLTNLAKAGRRSRTNQGVYHLECSLGSVLECAACADVAFVKGLTEDSWLRESKNHMQRIARMEVGLRKSWCGYIHEDEAEYHAGPHSRFPHESLQVYQSSLRLCELLEETVLAESDRYHRYAKRLDETMTSLVLNIAEGNGRFSELDHASFVNVAEDSGAVLAVYIDLMSSDCATNLAPAKALLREVIAMLAGLRAYLHGGER